MTLPEVTEVRRWTLRPGDRLIVRVDHRIAAGDAGRIKDMVRVSLALPGDFPVLLIEPGMDVEVAAS